jgi:hypothetical protein
MLDAAIDWHPTALLPLGPALTSDPPRPGTSP